MAPLAFTFSGIKVYIYNNDHLPIHIHAKKDEAESVFVLEIDNGKLVAVDVRTVENSNRLLSPADEKKVRKFLKRHWKKVVEKWTAAVIYKKAISITRISGI